MWICRHGLDTRVSHMKNSFYDIYLHSLGCQSLVLNTVFLLLVAIISPQEPKTLSISLGHAQTRIVCSGSTRLVTTPEISPRRWSLFGRKREEMFRLRSRKRGAAWSRGMMTLQAVLQLGLRLRRPRQLFLLFLSYLEIAGIWWNSIWFSSDHCSLSVISSSEKFSWKRDGVQSGITGWTQRVGLANRLPQKEECWIGCLRSVK